MKQQPPQTPHSDIEISKQAALLSPAFPPASSPFTHLAAAASLVKPGVGGGSSWLAVVLTGKKNWSATNKQEQLPGL